MSTELYRGLAKPLDGAGSVSDILDKAGLNWTVAPAPLLYQYGKETRPFQGRKALVRSDNGHGIAVVSDKFHVHQNMDIIEGLTKVAEAGNIQITHGGSLAGGEQVFLHGKVKEEFEAGLSKKVGDLVGLNFRMSTGHIPGRPTRLVAIALRLVCLNGATVTDKQLQYKETHRRDFDAEASDKVGTFIEGSTKQFGEFRKKVKLLNGTQMPRKVALPYTLELVQPEVFQSLVESFSKTPYDDLSGKERLDVLLQNEEKVIDFEQVTGRKAEYKMKRTTRAILDHLYSQPGAELAKGTAWNVYNAVSYYVDHLRGRGQADTAVESAISGGGAKLKEQALDLAVDYVERLQ